ncbi:MAG TPA: hypothetical protein VG271_08225, partial [Beijerinckiaceae bacterium]|nr:hypothetical protein [Beijerinckiaceae bacterium]
MSVLLFKTLRSTTFKLALTAIGIFGIVVIALFGYVYQATSSFVLGGVDRALDSELSLLTESYSSGGDAAVADRIRQRLADEHSADDVYLLADQSHATVAGNLAAWPPA